jgi:hypothetical protein
VRAKLAQDPNVLATTKQLLNSCLSCNRPANNPRLVSHSGGRSPTTECLGRGGIEQERRHHLAHETRACQRVLLLLSPSMPAPCPGAATVDLALSQP